MIGAEGDDTYWVDQAGDSTSEAAGAGTDRVFSSINHTLAANIENLNLSGSAAVNGTGNALGNTIVGNGAANVLNGGLGLNLLTGGAGGDIFLCDTALSDVGNVGVITDFNAAEDAIELDAAVFAGLSAGGVLDASSFQVSASAADADDRIIYDSASGSIFYDANGDGAGAATLFARVTAGTALKSSDFLVS